MGFRLRNAIAVAVMLCCSWLFAPMTRAADRFALLIGCSHYEERHMSSLPGASNDVLAFKELLSQPPYQFTHIATLEGWPEAVDRRPTAANISLAFEQLIERVTADSQVFILMAGHGTQIPIPADQKELLDPVNPEPDGLDEAFVAADADGTKNLVVDNQIGAWLDALVAKGSHVWIVFDCCFSGTMNRDLGPAPKSVKDIDAFDARREAVETPMWPKAKLPFVPVRGGSLVAFFASQEFETEADVVRPIGHADVPENRHGLLSYHLKNLLAAPLGESTYDELSRRLLTLYKADGRIQPTPRCHGVMSREVFGTRLLSTREPLTCKVCKDELLISGGLLASLEADTIVAAYSADDLAAQKPLGYFQVSQMAIGDSMAKAIAFERQPSVELRQLPASMFIRIVQRPPDDKLRLAISPALVKAKSEMPWRAEIESAARLGSSSFVITDDATQADYILEPGDADDGSTEIRLSRINAPHLQAPCAEYDSQWEGLSGRLIQDLSRLHAGNAIWSRLRAIESSGADESNLQLTFRTNETEPAQRLEKKRFELGDTCTLHLTNTSLRNYWYSVFCLTDELEIAEIARGAIQGRDFRDYKKTPIHRDVAQYKFADDHANAIGFFVIAVDQRAQKLQPSFDHLIQPGLGLNQLARVNVLHPRSRVSRSRASPRLSQGPSPIPSSEATISQTSNAEASNADTTSAEPTLISLGEADELLILSWFGSREQPSTNQSSQ